MKRIEDADLGRISAKAATTFFRASMKNYDMVRMNLLINAYVAGHWSGARHAEKHDGNRDPRAFLRRLMFWQTWPSVDELAEMMATQYLNGFPSLAIEDAALMRSVASMGFRRGLEWRMENGDDWDDGEGRTGAPEVRAVQRGGQARV